MIRKIAILAVAFLTATFSVPVFADITAIYGEPDSRQNIEIEVSDGGEMRIALGRDSYFLFLSDQTYVVEAGPGGPKAYTFEAMVFRARESRITSASSISASDKPEEIRFMAGNDVEIAGYQGTEYSVSDSSRVALILTENPKLLPLGRAYSALMNTLSATAGEDFVVFDNMRALLKNHGTLSLFDSKLASASFDPIDPKRFELSVDPITEADLIAAAPEPEPAVSAEAKTYPSPILAAIMHNSRLITRDRNGAAQIWEEGAAGGLDLNAPGQVIDFCTLGDELLIVTGKGEDDNISLWFGAPSVGKSGNWSPLTSFKETQSNSFHALDCSGAEPLLLTNAALQFPMSERSIAIDTASLSPGGYLTTLQHGGYLYVGANAGEWGGGLRRFSLSDGTATPVDSSDPDILCGGILNTSCAPVTGLAIDPANPDCILASVGMVHMSSSGQVVRVCGDGISLIYRKPVTLNPDWEENPTEEDLDSFSSMPFFSMASLEGSVWAVGSDGLYHFTDSPRPKFTPFERGKRWPASGVDWSHPDFVMLMTSMNQRHSLSGNSLLLIPRR